MVIEIRNFIGNKFVATDKYINSINPATGEVNAHVPDSGAEMVNQAVAAANAALPGWSATPAAERSRLLIRIAELIESRVDELAALESEDQGKPVWFAKAVDIPRAAYNFRFFATNQLHVDSPSTFQDQFSALNYVVRQPVGVCGLISPWNLPLYLLTWKIAPCIATGNTCVCKPSEFTSVTASKLCEILVEANLPPGVVNMVFGTGPAVGEPLVCHPIVRAVSFTGSTAVGTHIQQVAAPSCKKLSLELGGKNAAVIFKDCNLDKCIETTLRSSFINQGEICLCTSRIYVEEPLYQTFLAKFVEGARKMKVGDPKDPNNKLGALVSAQHFAKVESYVKLAREEGCNILCGHTVDPRDSKLNEKGLFMAPTVITDAKKGSRLEMEEIFGPVACIWPFTTAAEGIERANSVQYGLAATVWSSNVDTAHTVARKLEAGTVWVNCWMIRDLNMPFGGMKTSGIGREGAHDSVDFFTEAKTVCLQLTSA